MHLVSPSKLKALFLLPVLLILFSFGEGDKDIPKFPLSENSIEEGDFDISFLDEGNLIISTKENTFYIDGEVVDPSVEVRCEDEFDASYDCGMFVSPHFDLIDLIKCSPKTVSWEVGFRPNTGVIDPDNTAYKIVFYWDFDNNPGTFDNLNAVWNASKNSYTATGTHIYPQGGATCTYNARARLRINGSVCGGALTNLFQEIVVWDDIANSNIGTHETNHDTSTGGVEVGETVEICRGDDTAIILDDNSIFNCTGGFEANVANQNDEARWVQWVYGSANSVNTGGIGGPDSEKIAIDGVYYDDSEFPVYGEPTYQAANVTAPNSSTLDIQMPTTGTTAGEVFEVTMRSFNTCNPYDDDVSDLDGLNPDQGPMTYDIYDTNAGPGDTSPGGTRIDGGSGSFYASDAPITRIFDIVIVAIPAQLTVTDQKICVGDGVPILIVGNIDGGATEIIWYDDNKWTNPAANLLDTGAPPNNFDPALHGASDAAAASYSYWVTQRTGGALDCESEPVEVTVDVYENPDLTGWTYSIVSGASQCDAVTLDFDASATTNVVPGQTTYTWEIDRQNNFAGGHDYVVGPQISPTSSGLVVNHLGLTTNRRNWNIRLIVTNPASVAGCEVIDVGPDFSTYLTPTLSTTGDEIICSGDDTGIVLTHNSNSDGDQRYNWTVVTSNGVGDLLGASPGGPENHPYSIQQTLTNTTTIPQTATYTISVTNVEDVQSCKSADKVVVVTVNPEPLQPTITTSGSTICEDGSAVTLTATLSSGANSYKWYKNTVEIVGQTANTLVLSLDGDDGDYTVRGVGIAATLCEGILSAAETVLIEPLPTASDPTGGGSVCGTNPAPDIVWTLTGRPPFDITYTRTETVVGVAVVTTNVFSYTPPEAFAPYSFTITAPNPPAVATEVYEYEITVLDDDVDAPNPTCSGTSLGTTPAEVSIGGTAPVFDTPLSLSPTSDCDDGLATTDPTLSFSLDPANANGIGFVMTYTVDASANRAKLFDTDAAGDPTAAITFSDAELNNLAPSPHTIRIVSILSPTFCLSTFNTDLNFTVDPRPAAPTIPVDNIACETGGGTVLKVAVPGGANDVVKWYTDAAGTSLVTGVEGVVAGTKDSEFTPVLSDPAAYYTRIETTTTTCLSNSVVQVDLLEDTQPSDANAETGTAIGVPPAIVGTCDDTYTFNATPADNFGTGEWTTTDVGVTFTPDANTANATAHNIPVSTTLTFTWTVTSPLGTCATSSDNYDITRHALPIANDIIESYCEDANNLGFYDVTVADFAGYFVSITGGAPAVTRTVKYYPTTLDRTNDTNEIIAAYEVSSGDKVFVRVTSDDTSPTCDADSEVTFTINPLPNTTDLNNSTTTFCEDAIGSFTHAGVNLVTLYDATSADGVVVDRSVSYYTGYTLATHSFSGLINPGVGAGDDQNFTVFNGQTLFARVENTLTNCYDAAQIDFIVNSLPIPNAIIDPSLATPAIINVCKDPISILLFQVDGTVNVGSTYDWTIPAIFEVVGGGGLSNGGNSSDFFVLLRFPNTTLPAGEDILIIETSVLGCVGAPNSMTIIVEDAPSQPAITGLDDVCTDQTAVVYTVVPANATSSYLWSIPTDASIVGPTDESSITVNFGLVSGNISVTETSASGCTSPAAAPKVITVHGRPTMAAGLDATVCSDDIIGLVFGFTGVPAATSYDIVFVDVPAALAADGGNMATDGNTYDNVADNFVVNDRFTNNTGGPLLVRYQVEPVSTTVIDCNGTPPLDIFIEILPEPLMGLNADLTKTTCSNVASGLIMGVQIGSVAATKYIYDLAAAIPGGLTPVVNALIPSVTPGGEDDDYLLNDTYENLTGTSLVVQYSVRAVSADGCVGDPETINLIVDPEPVMSSAIAETICSGDSPAITFTSDVAGTTYSWVVTNVTGVTGTTIGDLGTVLTSEVLTNMSGAVGSVVYDVTPSGPAALNCVGTVQTVTITVDPEPVMSSTTTEIICSGGSPTIAFSSNVVGTTFSWVVTNVTNITGTTIGDIGTVLTGEVLNNTSGLVGSVVYDVTPTGPAALNCVGAIQTVTITIEPAPVMSSAIAETICSGGSPTINLASNVAGSTFNWVVINVTNVTGTLIGDTGTDLTTETLTNISGAAGSVVYDITPTGPVTLNCVGAVQTVTITVDPEPVMSSTTSETICSGDSPSIGFTSNVGGSTFVWVVTNVTNVTGTIIGDVGVDLTTEVLTNISGLAGSVVYDVTPTGPTALNCVGAVQSVTITVDPEPVLSSPTSETICSGGSPTIGFTSNVPGTSYSWIVTNTANITGTSVGDVGIALTTEVISNTSGAVGFVEYNVTPTGPAVLNCIGAIQTVTISVDPAPVMTSSATETICSGASPSISFTSNVASTTFSWVVTSITNVTGTNLGDIGSDLTTETLNNVSGIAGTVIYDVTPTGPVALNCVGSIQSITITVEPEPVMSSAVAESICSGDSPSIVLASNVVGSSFSWVVTNVTNVTGTIIGDVGIDLTTEVLNNISGISGSVVYDITPTGPATLNCTGVIQTVTITIDPEPVLTSGTLETICSRGSPTIAFTSNVAGSTFAWVVTSVTNVTGTIVGDVGTDLTSEALINVSGLSGSVIYDVTPTGPVALNCVGAIQTVTVNVDPEPVMTSGVAETVCSRDSPTIVFSTNVPGSTYAWIVTSVTNVTGTVIGDVGTDLSTETLTNVSGLAGSVIYDVTPTGPLVLNCVGAVQSITVTVDPEPVITSLDNETICSGATPSIVFTSNVAGSTFAWEVTGVSSVTGTVLGDVGIDFTGELLTNTTGVLGSVTYQVTATGPAATNCVGAVQTVTITVEPEPVINSISAETICSGSSPTIVFTSNVAGATYNWIVTSVNNVTGTIVGNTGTADLTTEVLTNSVGVVGTVTYDVTPTGPTAPSLGCTGAIQVITVTVQPGPVVVLGQTSSFCSGEPIDYEILITPLNTPAGTEFIWAPPTMSDGSIQGSPGINIPADPAGTFHLTDVLINTSNAPITATYSIIPVGPAPFNCPGASADVVITINPAPALSTALDKIICNDAPAGILLADNGTSIPAATYKITAISYAGLTADAGNAEFTSGPLPITTANINEFGGDMYNNPSLGILIATYTVVPISVALCEGPASDIVVTIEPFIIAVPNNNSSTICSNDFTDIDLISSGVPSAGAVSFNVSVVVTSGAASGFIPSLNFLPEGHNIADVLINTGNVDAVVEYTITPSASAAANNTGCTGSSVTLSVTVEPLPQVTPGQILQICSDPVNGINYQITTLNGLVDTEFYWGVPTVSDPGLIGGAERLEVNASSNPIPDILENTTSARQSAIYLVTPVRNTCKGTPVQVTIFVDPTPAGTIAIDQPVVCSGGFALLSFSMTVGTAPFEIVYNDGTSDITVSNIANSHFIALPNITASTTYTFKSITDANNCVLNPVNSQVSVTVENPVSLFSLDTNVGCTPLEVTFTNNDIQAGTVYEWNFGDGSANLITTDVTVVHSYINNSTVSDISFSPMLTATRTNGAVVCTNLSSKFVTINAGVSLNVTPSVTEGCSPLSVNFNNLSQGVLVNEWYWRLKVNPADKNDIQTSFPASYTLINATTTSAIYEVVYVGTRNGCSDEIITEITVYPEVVADFTVAPSTTVSINNPTITVDNTTGEATSWTTLWEWGDGQSTTNIQPGSHTYDAFGIYELKLTVRDPSGVCESVKIEVITVEPTIPEVDFAIADGYDAAGCMPLTVLFDNLSVSVDPNTYVWKFVDETGATIGTSTAETPEFTFFQPGIINVSLVGSNPLGVTDTETKLGIIEIYELPTAALAIRPEVVFLPDQLMFTSNLSRLADEFQWDFDGDGIYDSEEFEPSFKYTDPGVYDIALIAKNTDTGCSDTTILLQAVTVVESGSSDIPNGFFPGSGLGGGDDGSGGGSGGAGGSNTMFLPRIKGVRDDGFKMQVFDRWGHLLYESNTKTEGWNGRHYNTGKLMPAGVYVYKLELVYVSGEQTTIVGDINLIR